MVSALFQCCKSPDLDLLAAISAPSSVSNPTRINDSLSWPQEATGTDQWGIFLSGPPNLFPSSRGLLHQDYCIEKYPDKNMAACQVLPRIPSPCSLMVTVGNSFGFLQLIQNLEKKWDASISYQQLLPVLSSNSFRSPFLECCLRSSL